VFETIAARLLRILIGSRLGLHAGHAVNFIDPYKFTIGHADISDLSLLKNHSIGLDGIADESMKAKTCAPTGSVQVCPRTGDSLSVVPKSDAESRP
jgi:hypothetical protein